MTLQKIYDIFSVVKAKTKTCVPGKILKRGCRLVQGSRNPAGDDTTSEPQGRNALTGAPVKASMSDGLAAVTRVEPWNTFVSHP